jgi:hypothetical protein
MFACISSSPVLNVSNHGKLLKEEENKFKSEIQLNFKFIKIIIYFSFSIHQFPYCHTD